MDARDLLPFFEGELWEYPWLPGFSLVAFERPLSIFNESFQYDILHPVVNGIGVGEGDSCPLETHVIAKMCRHF